MSRKYSATVAASLLPLLPCAAQAQDAATQPASERYLLDLLQAGGWAMFPLAFCLLAVLYLLVFCARETARKRFFPANITAAAGNPPLTRDSNNGSDTTLFARALQRGLGKARGKPVKAARAAAESAIAEMLAHAEAEHLRWIGYLNIIAAIAPMIGLLGTVSGMIGAFGTISLGGMGRPEMLAGDIGEALITTATGLCIAIPAMLCYHVLHNRLGLRMNETISRLNDALDLALPDPQADADTQIDTEALQPPQR